MGLNFSANITEDFGTNMDNSEKMAMLQGEIDNLNQKIAFLEAKLKELESNRDIPKAPFDVQ